MAEADLADITSMLEDVQKAKSDAEEKATLYAREKSQLQSQLDENEEELAEVIYFLFNYVFFRKTFLFEIIQILSIEFALFSFFFFFYQRFSFFR